MQETVKSKLKSLLPYFLLVIAAIVVHRLITEISFFTNAVGTIWRIVTPFFYGFLLAYIMNIPYSGMQQLLGKARFKFVKKRKKLLSAIFTFLFFALLLFLIVRLLIPHVYRLGSFFITNLPAYFEMTLRYIEYLNNLELFDIYISPESILAMLQDVIQQINIEHLAAPINALLSLPMAVFTAVLTFISSIYILVEKDKFKKFLCRALTVFTPANVYSAIIDYGSRLNRNFKRYVHVQTLDGCILGTIVTLQLLLLRSPYALILGVMLGILNYIPYFGSIIGTIIAIVVILFTQGIAMAGIAAVLLLVTQQIDGNIIQPKLMGGSFSLSPLLIIISVTIGGATAGALGMIAAIPIVAVLKDMLENIIAHYERKKLAHQDKTDLQDASPDNIQEENQ